MKTNHKVIAVLSALGIFSLQGAVVRPADDGRALTNPGMGWTMHYYSNNLNYYGAMMPVGDDCVWFPGCSVVYLRLPWSDIEPEEGVFNWNVVDSIAARWIDRGGQIAFRITCSETGPRYATPKWVMDAGAKGTYWNFGWGKAGGPDPNGKFWDPDFNDPVFLAKLENFMKAFGERYDGRKEVAFIDVGTYGLWGEGHTHGSSQPSAESRERGLKKHIDLHVKYFKKTSIVISDDVDGWNNQTTNHPILDYARERGVGYRDDSIMVMPPPNAWFHANQAELYWRTLPVVLEHEHYRNQKWWNGDDLLKSIEEYHASYMSIHGDPYKILKENREAVDKINRRIGYRFQLKECEWPDKVRVGKNNEKFSVKWKWANGGVAPCYADAFACLTLKTPDGKIIAVLSDEGFNLKDLQPGEPGKAVVRESSAKHFIGQVVGRNFKSCELDVFVSVGMRDGTPVYELPLGNSDEHRRYKVGKIMCVVE